MKRIISALAALCLLAALGFAGAEEAPSKGSPWTNPWGTFRLSRLM